MLAVVCDECGENYTTIEMWLQIGSDEILIVEAACGCDPKIDEVVVSND